MNKQGMNLPSPQHEFDIAHLIYKNIIIYYNLKNSTIIVIILIKC